MTRRKLNIKDGPSRIDVHGRMQDLERMAARYRESAKLPRDPMGQDRMYQWVMRITKSFSMKIMMETSSIRP